MNQFVTGQRSLSNFFRSVNYDNPSAAALMHEDIILVALHAMAPETSPARERGKEAAENLRSKALDLPEIHKRILDYALADLGY